MLPVFFGLLPESPPATLESMARPREIPKLLFTEYRGIGWNVRFYDPKTQQRRRHRFILTKKSDRPKAEELYLRWLRDEYGHAAPEPEGET